jgi:hypothetical protein
MSHASLCTATSASQSFRSMPSRAKLTPRQGSGSSGGTSTAGSSTDQRPSGLPAQSACVGARARVHARASGVGSCTGGWCVCVIGGSARARPNKATQAVAHPTGSCRCAVCVRTVEAQVLLLRVACCVKVLDLCCREGGWHDGHAPQRVCRTACSQPRSAARSCVLCLLCRATPQRHTFRHQRPNKRATHQT